MHHGEVVKHLKLECLSSQEFRYSNLFKKKKKNPQVFIPQGVFLWTPFRRAYMDDKLLEGVREMLHSDESFPFDIAEELQTKTHSQRTL